MLTPLFIEHLKNIYEKAGFEYIDRGDGGSFKTADLSAALSYFLYVKPGDICFDDLFGYKAYLYGMYSIIQYRKKKSWRWKKINQFLNKNKYKFFNKLAYKDRYGDEWSKDNIKIFYESEAVSSVIYFLAEKKRLKLRMKK